MSALRVAYDVTPILQGRTGIARYTAHLDAGLAAAGIDLRRFAIGRATFPVPAHTRHLPVPLRVVARSWALGGPPRVERLTGPVDVVHSTGLVVPRSKHPIVLTIHDTDPLDHPELHAPRTVRAFHAMMRALPDVALVVTVSEAVATDLVRHGVDRDRIAVVYEGRTDWPAPTPVDIDGPFLLTVGAQVPRKDHATLVRAFAQADLGAVRLVLAGPEGEATSALEGLVAELGLGDRVRFLGAVDDASLAWLYGAALGFCFPSRGEGFGLPVVEAMAAGLPVVASEIPPTVEIAGDVALLHPVGDVAGCAAALERVGHEPGLRDELATIGRQRAARFTWARAATQTIAAYERALTQA